MSRFTDWLFDRMDRHAPLVILVTGGLLVLLLVAKGIQMNADPERRARESSQLRTYCHDWCSDAGTPFFIWGGNGCSCMGLTK